MTDKDRCIEAVEILIKFYKFYKSGLHDYFNNCPLCELYLKKHSDCSGCPNAVNGSIGCYQFDSYDNYKFDNAKSKPRLEFWQTALPFLKKTKNKYFEPDRFKRRKFSYLLKIEREL